MLLELAQWLSKDIRAFNVFNYTNYGCFNTFNPTDTANFGHASCTVSDPRRLQIGAEYNF